MKFSNILKLPLHEIAEGKNFNNEVYQSQNEVLLKWMGSQKAFRNLSVKLEKEMAKR